MSAALDLTPVRQWSAWAATPWEDAATPVGDQGASTPEFRQPVFTQHDQQHEHKGPGSPWSPWSPSVGGWQPQLEAVDGNSSSAAQDIKQPHSDNRSAVPWKLGKLTPMSICKATPGLHASASDHSRSCQQQCSTSTPCPTTQRRVSLHHSGHMRTPGGQRAGPAGGMVSTSAGYDSPAAPASAQRSHKAPAAGSRSVLKIADAVARVASAIKNRASLLTPQCPSARLGKFSAQEGAGPLSFKHDAAQDECAGLSEPRPVTPLGGFFSKLEAAAHSPEAGKTMQQPQECGMPAQASLSFSAPGCSRRSAHLHEAVSDDAAEQAANTIRRGSKPRSRLDAKWLEVAVASSKAAALRCKVAAAAKEAQAAAAKEAQPALSHAAAATAQSSESQSSNNEEVVVTATSSIKTSPAASESESPATTSAGWQPVTRSEAAPKAKRAPIPAFTTWATEKAAGRAATSSKAGAKTQAATQQATADAAAAPAVSRSEPTATGSKAAAKPPSRATAQPATAPDASAAPTSRRRMGLFGNKPAAEAVLNVNNSSNGSSSSPTEAVEPQQHKKRSRNSGSSPAVVKTRRSDKSGSRPRTNAISSPPTKRRWWDLQGRRSDKETLRYIEQLHNDAHALKEEAAALNRRALRLFNDRDWAVGDSKVQRAQKLQEADEALEEATHLALHLHNARATFRIDLHNCPVSAAKSKVAEQLEALQYLARTHPHGVLWQVVVGRGRHSADNVPRIKPAVWEFLEQKQQEAAARNEAGCMQVEMQRGNDGVIEVILCYQQR